MVGAPRDAALIVISTGFECGFPMGPAKVTVLLETSTDAFVVCDGCFIAIGCRLADEHDVIATGQQPPLFIKSDLDVTQSEIRFRQIDRDALPAGDRPGGPVRKLLCRRHGLTLRYDIVGKRSQ